MEAEAHARKLHAALTDVLSRLSDNDGDWYLYDSKIDGSTVAKWQALLDKEMPCS